MVLQVILILLFLFMMLGAVFVIGIDGTISPGTNRYPDRYQYENDSYPKWINGDELSRIVIPRGDMFDPKHV